MKNTPSITFRLALAFSVGALLAALIAGTSAYLAILDEVHEFQDDILKQTAQLFDPAVAPARIGEEDEVRIDIEPLHAPARHRAILSPELGDGYHDLGKYRVYVYSYTDRRLAFLQETEFRDDTAQESAFHAVTPLILLIPFLILLTLMILHFSLSPLKRLAREVEARSDADLSPLKEERIPREIIVFVRAINRLLARSRDNLKKQQRFIADAAHELRSPLTALSLQAERLQSDAMSAQNRERLHTLREGIRRSRHLLEQLLSLARAQNPEQRRYSRLSVQNVMRRVVSELHLQAAAKQIDLGIDGEEDGAIDGEETMLYTLLRNLTDNAVRHIPPGGRIDLRLRRDRHFIRLEVEDSGAGIAESERARIFEPFYRPEGTQAEGSGLGLSIAKTLTQELGGRIELTTATRFAHGLKVVVWLPAAK